MLAKRRHRVLLVTQPRTPLARHASCVGSSLMSHPMCRLRLSPAPRSLLPRPRSSGPVVAHGRLLGLRGAGDPRRRGRSPHPGRALAEARPSSASSSCASIRSIGTNPLPTASTRSTRPAARACFAARSSSAEATRGNRCWSTSRRATSASSRSCRCPVRSHARLFPGPRAVVVITKDVWSLYVDFDVQGTAGGLELLSWSPRRRTSRASAHGAPSLRPQAQLLLAGRELRGAASGRTLARSARRREPESSTGTPARPGSYGGVTITRPLYSATPSGRGLRASRGPTRSSGVRQRRGRDVHARAARDDADPVGLARANARRAAQADALVRVDTKNDFTLGGSFAHATTACLRTRRSIRRPSGSSSAPRFRWVRPRGAVSAVARVFQRFSARPRLRHAGLQEDARLGHDSLAARVPGPARPGLHRTLRLLRSGGYGVALATASRARRWSRRWKRPDSVTDASIRGGSAS